VALQGNITHTDTNANVAQQVEHLICNQNVAGSIPVVSSKKIKIKKVKIKL